MASDLILDLEPIDRDHVAVDRATLDEYLPQRGTFAVLDHLVYDDEESAILVGVKTIRDDDWWAADHIPGRPMFPGALMIEAAAQIGSFDYSCHRSDRDDDRFVGFGGVEKTRFRGIVEPPCRFFVVVKLERAGSRMFRYAAQGFVEREGVLQPKMVFESTVLGIVF